MRLRLVSAEKGLDFDDVLIVPQRSDGKSRDNIILERQFITKHSGATFTSVPIIAANMYATGTFKMAMSLSKHKVMTALHKYYTNEQIDEFITQRDITQNRLVFITIGESEKELIRLRDIIDAETALKHSYMINIDVANGYRSSFIEFIYRVRNYFPNAVIMAGNVCTPEMTQEIIIAGADIVKIGIGPGSACETRKMTGVGYPQLSAISECANAAHNLRGFICADGGCKTPGDVCKAFCAGADFVMLGGMLAGTDECDGEWTCSENKYYKYIDPKSSIIGTYPFVEGGIIGICSDGISVCTLVVSKNGLVEYGDRKSLKFYGMSSKEAMEKHGGADKEYRASEGKCVEVSYKGPVDNIIKEILGGLRSCGTYIGAMQIKHFPKHANFVRVK